MLTELDISAPHAWGSATYPPGAIFGPRLLADYEFVWMTEGDARYVWDTKSVDAPQGAIVLGRPGVTDFFQWDAHKPTRHGFFHFGLERLPADWPAPSAWPLVRETQPDGWLPTLFRRFLSAGDAPDSLARRLLMAQILAAFVLDDGDAALLTRPLWPDSVQRAWRFLHHALDTAPHAPVTLAEMASAACVMPEHLCRLFRVHVGHPPMETLALARLDRALALLTRANYSVTEVAEMCGYANPFHFSRRFARGYGVSPRAAQQAARAGLPVPRPLLPSYQSGIGTS